MQHSFTTCIVHRKLCFFSYGVSFRTTQEEIEKAEKAITACEGPASEDSNVRRGLISLKSHRETKVSS